jgi:hypothetical protein
MTLTAEVSTISKMICGYPVGVGWVGGCLEKSNERQMNAKELNETPHKSDVCLLYLPQGIYSSFQSSITDGYREKNSSSHITFHMQHFYLREYDGRHQKCKNLVRLKKNRCHADKDFGNGCLYRDKVIPFFFPKRQVRLTKT